MNRTKSQEGHKGSSFKGKVPKVVEKDIERDKESGLWWNKYVKFNHDLTLSAGNHVVEELFDELYANERIYKRTQKMTNLRVLIANLLWQNERKQPLRIPLDEKKWDESRQNRRYRRIMGRSVPKLVHMLHQKGYIEMKKGNEITHRETRICATEKLLALCERLPEPVISEPVELVELRTFQGKMTNTPTKEHPKRVPKPVYELASYTDTKKTISIRKTLHQVNEVNNGADIRYSNRKINVSLVAIFQENFSMYGRLHTRGYYHLQGLSKAERAELTINKEPVVELDYSALHPNLLYAGEGIQFPLTKDPYSVVNDHRFVRPLLKIILLAMINADSFNQAQAVANHWIITEKIRNKDGVKVDTQYRRLKSIGIDNAGHLIKQMEKEHAPIAKHFFNGRKTGMRIMNKDAAIALDVVKHFSKKGIPILPVHDSFIVQAQYKDELKNVMEQAYQKHTNGYLINIK